MISALRRIGADRAGDDFRRLLVLAVAAGVTQGLALAAMVPALVSLFRSDDSATLTWLLVLAVGAALNAVISVTATLAGFTASTGIIAAMHDRLGDRLVRLPLAWFEPRRTGRTSHVAVRGTMFAAQTSMDIVVPVVVNVSTPATIAVVTFVFDWRLGLALVVAAPVIWGAAWIAQRAIARGARTLHDVSIETDTRLLEFARHQVALRSGNVRGTQYRPLADAIEAQRRAGRRALLSRVFGTALQSAVVQGVFGVVIALAVLRAVDGADPVLMVAVIGLLAQFTGPLRILAELGSALRRAGTEMEEVHDILTSEVMPTPDRSSDRPRDNEVVLSGVRFGYGTERVLDGLDLTLAPGRTTALVGASGSGKTTVTRLIARFHDVDGGEIRLGGVPVQDLTEHDLMSRLSLVFQDVFLLDDTLEANIAFGEPDADADRVRRAARLARVDEIAERLSDGWNTRVGEGGSLLSGGERQRVSIARALVKSAPVLLLDEATAALDPTTGAAVRTALAELRGETTVLVIAHQLDTIAGADDIAFLENGRIVEQGTHTELIRQQGRYASFWEQRSQATTWRV